MHERDACLSTDSFVSLKRALFENFAGLGSEAGSFYEINTGFPQSQQG